MVALLNQESMPESHMELYKYTDERVWPSDMVTFVSFLIQTTTPNSYLDPITITHSKAIDTFRSKSYLFSVTQAIPTNWLNSIYNLPHYIFFEATIMPLLFKIIM